MTETKRIRWSESRGADPAWTGSVGTVNPSLFQIYAPDGFAPQWVLTTSFPGMDDKRSYADDPDELKAEAERWLEEFAASLGAVFPEALRESVRSERDKCEDAATRLLKDHQYDTGMRRQGWADALDWVLAEIDQPSPSAPGGAGKE